MSGVKHTTREKDKRVAFRKRFNPERVYEELRIIKDGNKNAFYVDIENHTGFFTIGSIIEFEECDLSYVQLSRRIFKIRNKDGKYTTMSQVILNKKNVKSEIKKSASRDITKDPASIKAVKDIAQVDLFNSSMKLFKIGSLCGGVK